MRSQDQVPVNFRRDGAESIKTSDMDLRHPTGQGNVKPTNERICLTFIPSLLLPTPFPFGPKEVMELP